MNKNSITIYWSTSMFTKETEQFSMLYTAPVSVLDKFRENMTSNQSMFSCPAFKNTLKNTFAFNAPLSDTIHIPERLETEAEVEVRNSYVEESQSQIALLKVRHSSIKNYHNVTYNLGWNFFADEPVIAKFTAPFYPPTSPAEGALLAPGEFDIGSWFRPYNLDYHLPFGVRTMVFTEGEPLFFMKLMTDKKVTFKEYLLTPYLNKLAAECSDSPRRYGYLKPLSTRYEMARKSRLKDKVLGEIKRNLVE